MHLQKKAEDAIDELTELMPPKLEEEAGAGVGGAQPAGYGCVVCDMNCDPRDAARLLQNIRHLLAPGAWCVLTVKLVRKGKEECLQMMGAAYQLLTAAGFTNLRDYHL